MLKEFADDNFKFDKNGKKLSKQVENTLGKGEIARYEQFLLFPQCFLKAWFPEAPKGVIVWEWVKNSERTLRSFIWLAETEYLGQSETLMTHRIEAFENFSGKGENAGHHHFSFSHNICRLSNYGWVKFKLCFQFRQVCFCHGVRENSLLKHKLKAFTDDEFNVKLCASTFFYSLRVITSLFLGKVKTFGCVV